MTHKAMKAAGRKNSRNSITAFAARFRIFTSVSKKRFQKVIWSSAIAKATHTGAGFGMESTGKPVAFEGMLTFRVRDGKVVEAWNSFDFLKMFQQMGVVKLAGG